ncbi:hypothetical protein RvY_08160 [Ramazzottius varieornatus]|uniref:Uncharacterized protein n=1 Tax=Ramazzottius varieornatus TaxID=947166 RepID=A0A1D1VE26_RAMVA|nr:hypothetical protein RvY_08160 [Ramazzottius varieornatus]
MGDKGSAAGGANKGATGGKEQLGAVVKDSKDLKAQESDDDLHEDRIVREILALAKAEVVTSYTATTKAFEIMTGTKPTAGESRNIHLRLSALEVLKPFLSDLTISAVGVGKGVIHELHTKRGLGKFLRSYRTDHHLPSVLTTLRFEHITIRFDDLRNVLPPSVKTLHFAACTIKEINVETTPNGRAFRHVSDSQHLEEDTIVLDILPTDDGNFPALGRAMFKRINAKFEHDEDWDDFVRWLATTIEETKNKSKKNQAWKAAEFWNKTLRQQDLNVPMPKSDSEWYSFFQTADRLAVKDMSAIIGGRFRKPRPPKTGGLPPKNTTPGAPGTPGASGTPPPAGTTPPPPKPK